jgi:hypothetical protein
MVFGGFGTQANLFDLNLLLRSSGFFFFFRPLVNEFAVVNDSAYGRVCVWGYFHQV